MMQVSQRTHHCNRAAGTFRSAKVLRETVMLMEVIVNISFGCSN